MCSNCSQPPKQGLGSGSCPRTGGIAPRQRLGFVLRTMSFHRSHMGGIKTLRPSHSPRKGRDLYSLTFPASERESGIWITPFHWWDSVSLTFSPSQTEAGTRMTPSHWWYLGYNPELSASQTEAGIRRTSSYWDLGPIIFSTFQTEAKILTS